MEGKFLKLKDVGAYVRSYTLSNEIWHTVVKWQYFEKKTIGDQFVRAMDSISANIAEGFGRYHKKDKVKFYRYAFGSLYESLDWNQKAYSRTLITKEQYQHILNNLTELPKEIYALINFTNEKLKY